MLAKKYFVYLPKKKEKWQELAGTTDERWMRYSQLEGINQEKE
jgi:hypothetical protein